ncbi:MAG: PAS domain S-box protein [Methanobacterium sp. ERen5]|nr:MAG: PAS domain S-box protein [Methanobacterium sp. ERen5]
MSDVSKEFLIDYRTIFKSSPDAVIITQSDGSISYANSAAEELFGYTQREICEIGRSGIVDTADPHLDLMLAEREKTGKYNGELMHIKKDGTKFAAEISANAFMDEKGVKRNLITIRDITKRKIDENRIKFQALLLSKVNDAVFGLDLNFRIVYLNWGAKKMFGYTQEEVLGRNPYELLQTNINQDLHSKEQVLNGRTSTLVGVKHKNGNNLIVEQNLTKITSESVTTAGYVVIYHDMTDYKMAENTAQHALKRLYSILSNIRASVLLVTNDNKVEYLNPAFCDYFHLREQPEDLIGISDKTMIKKIKNSYIDPEAEIARIKEITTTMKPVTDEEVTMKTGETCIRDFIPITMDGKSYGRLWLHLDISERKKVEEHKQNLLESREKLTDKLQASNQELVSLTQKLQITNQIVEANRDELLTVNLALKESQEKFSKAFHANSASVIISDLDGYFSDVNHSYTQLTGYSRSELIGNRSVDLGIIRSEDRERFQKNWQTKVL